MRLLDKDADARAGNSYVAKAQFFSPVDWREVATKRTSPPAKPELPPYLQVASDGQVRFLSETDPTRAKTLATPRRVTFDEENDTPTTKKATYAEQRAVRRTFRGFALDPNVDLAASPATYRSSSESAASIGVGFDDGFPGAHPSAHWRA